MAIPFIWPSDEETENHYLSMDDLLWQLYNVLRQILLHQQNNIHVQVPAPPPAVVPQAAAPDAAQAVASCGAAPQAIVPRAPPRRARRRRTQRREKEMPLEAPRSKAVETRDNWTQVGEDLRQIADEFTTSTSLQVAEDPKCLETTTNNLKLVSFLSLLIPPPFRGSLWMPVVFLFGWGALRRFR